MSPSDLAIRAFDFAEDFEAERKTHGANAGADTDDRGGGSDSELRLDHR